MHFVIPLFLVFMHKTILQKTKSLHLIYVIMLERNFFRISYCFPSQQLSRPCVKTRPFFRRFHGIMNLLKIHMKCQFNKHKKLVIFHSIIFQMLMHHNENILFITMKMYYWRKEHTFYSKPSRNVYSTNNLL
jgi:hypothetical protein